MKSERLPVRQKCETFPVVEQQIMMYIVLFVIFISIKEVTGQFPCWPSVEVEEPTCYGGPIIDLMLSLILPCFYLHNIDIKSEQQFVFVLVPTISPILVQSSASSPILINPLILLELFLPFKYWILHRQWGNSNSDKAHSPLHINI